MRPAREFLAEVYAQHGQFTPELLVDAARAPGHPDHDRFIWDDSVAGERYRVVQAQGLIRSVATERVSPGAPQVRQYLSVQMAPHTTPVYRRTEEVVADPLMREVALKAMRRDWAALQARYGHFTEFVEMVLQDLPTTAPV